MVKYFFQRTFVSFLLLLFFFKSNFGQKPSDTIDELKSKKIFNIYIAPRDTNTFLRNEFLDSYSTSKDFYDYSFFEKKFKSEKNKKIFRINIYGWPDSIPLTPKDFPNLLELNIYGLNYTITNNISSFSKLKFCL